MEDFFDEIIGLNEFVDFKSGRNCYAFSDEEDSIFDYWIISCKKLFESYSLIESQDFDFNIDPFGNLFVIFYGDNREEFVLSGSHVDSVVDGGWYDGICGVVSAFNYLKALVVSQQKPIRSYIFVIFRAEESSPTTGYGALGSAVATGLISVNELVALDYNNHGNVTKFADYFVNKYGFKRWRSVLASLDSPFLKSIKIISYEELHIEQSANLENYTKDVGIVQFGIGGNRRERIELDVSASKVDASIGVEYRMLKMLFVGKSAHSGGTPHNFVKKLSELSVDDIWHRQDALLASLYAIDYLMSEFKVIGQDFLIFRFEPNIKTGFTTIVAEQHLDLVFNAANFDQLQGILIDLAEWLQKERGVMLQFDFSDVLDNNQMVLYNELILPAIFIPLKLETILCNFSSSDVRMTVADMFVQGDQLMFNIDFRNVNLEVFDLFMAKIDQSLIEFGDQLLMNRKLISQKEFVPFQNQFYKVKIDLAQKLGLSYLLLPSMPTHDAANIARITDNVSMTFIRHDGISHSSVENVELQYFVNAQSLSHKFLDYFLKKY